MKLTIVETSSKKKKKLHETDDWAGMIPPPLSGDTIKFGGKTYLVVHREIGVERSERRFIGGRKPPVTVSWVESITLFVSPRSTAK